MSALQSVFNLPGYNDFTDFNGMERLYWLKSEREQYTADKSLSALSKLDRTARIMAYVILRMQ